MRNETDDPRRRLLIQALAMGLLPGGLNWVEATPKEKDTGFERVRLGLQGKTLAAMELHDQLGGRTMLRFLDLKANAPVAADSFRFTPPKGADVLEDK